MSQTHRPTEVLTSQTHRPTEVLADSQARRPQKQQKLDDGELKVSCRLQKVLNICSASDASVIKLMKALEGQAPAKATVTANRNAKFDSLMHTIRVPLEKGGEWDWELCHPGLLLSRLVSESQALQAGFKDALSRHPCTPDRPWGLVVGFDEAVPGNKLALNNSRKSMNLSFSFQELEGSTCQTSCCGHAAM